MKKNLIIFIFGLLIITSGLFYLINKQSRQTSKGTNKLKVSTSIYPLYFFSSQIGGDKADVLNITPAGIEPHVYEPSTRDIAQVENGNMLILNGGIEAWGSRIDNNLKGTNVKIILAGAGLLTQKDPHIWLDPQLAKKEVRAIAQGFISIDPKNSGYYTDNENNLNYKLDLLDSAFIRGLQNCQSRDFITSHAAFSYLAKRYGLDQVSISGLSPDQEPSGRQLVDIAKFAKEHNVRYIFFEKLVSPKLSETIAAEIGAKTLVLDPIEGISDDDIRQGENYFTIMQSNLKNLQLALGCQVK